MNINSIKIKVFNLQDIYSACSNTEHFPVIFDVIIVSSLLVNKTSCLKNCLPEKFGRSVGVNNTGPWTNAAPLEY